MNGKIKNGILATSVILGTILLCGLGFEVLVRIHDAVKGYGAFSGHRNILTKPFKRIVPFRTFGPILYREADGRQLISSSHAKLFPYEKPSGIYRIICLGGSTTESKRAFRDYGIHYPMVLQQLLNDGTPEQPFEVINLGFSGYATPHSLILLELDVISMQPDLIIVSHNINDLTTAYWPGLLPDYSNKYSHPVYSIPDYSSRFSVQNVLFQHSAAYWLIKSRIYKLKQKMRISRIQKGSTIQRISYGDEPPVEGQVIYERNLKSMVVLARQNGIRIILGGQALCTDEKYFEYHMAFKKYNKTVRYPLHSEFIHHHHRYNAIMKRTAEMYGAYFVDNDAALADKRENFSDFVHYSDKGIRALAESYARFIDGHILGKASPPLRPASACTP